MARSYKDTDREARNLLEDIRRGVFSPIYLLMGEEPYYPEMVADAVISNCLQEWERDFNEFICYGSDTPADTVITAARRFPMMAERQLVVVKEAQQMKSLEELAIYCQQPLDSTVLVILMRGASADKRKALYKAVSKNGTVLESVPIRDYEMAGWIGDYYASRGLSIAPDAAVLLAESAGSDPGKVAVETDKMLKNLPEGTTEVTLADIERNVGISRQFSVFELTKALSFRNGAAALRTASFIGDSPRFALPAVTGPLFNHFNRILRYGALLADNPHPGNDEKARILGVNPFFFKEYDSAVRYYPVPKAMAAVGLLAQYDYKGKGGESGEATPSELLKELVTKLLTL